MDPLVEARARLRVDAAHAADPVLDDGQAAELLYADRVEAEVVRLIPGAAPLLRLAARCQHLERWAISRSTFPQDKPGYFAWRKAVHARQGERAEALLIAGGVAPADAALVRTWVAKLAPRSAEGQALEDAACLVFFRHEVPGFAAKHPDYTADKYVDIIRKTWRKMSADGQAAARAIPFDEPLAGLVARALSG